MHAALALASLASLATLGFAQTIPGGYGRFPCTQIINGQLAADPNQCLDTALVNPAGVADPTAGSQGANANPTGSSCSLETETGAYFCGIAGAFCTADNQCDNGSCDTAIQKCQGGFLQACTGGVDAGCSGFLYCTSADQSVTTTCGNIGAFCQDPYAIANTDGTPGAIATATDYFCQSGYCSNADGNCALRVTTIGGDCTLDAFACGNTATGQQLTCVVDGAGVGTCQINTASHAPRSRSRRAALTRRNLCPASHTACAVEGAKGFECIDTTSNIEQCGACASAGGVDCTAIEGVAAVGCVAGTCEIWSCEDGFTYDAATGSCTSA